MFGAGPHLAFDRPTRREGGGCPACPSLRDLMNFRLVSSTGLGPKVEVLWTSSENLGPERSRSTMLAPERRCEVVHLKCFELEAPPGFEPGMEVLQTSALPLGDGAGWNCVRGKDQAASKCGYNSVRNGRRAAS